MPAPTGNVRDFWGRSWAGRDPRRGPAQEPPWGWLCPRLRGILGCPPQIWRVSRAPGLGSPTSPVGHPWGTRGAGEQPREGTARIYRIYPPAAAAAEPQHHLVRYRNSGCNRPLQTPSAASGWGKKRWRFHALFLSSQASSSPQILAITGIN